MCSLDKVQSGELYTGEDMAKVTKALKKAAKKDKKTEKAKETDA